MEFSKSVQYGIFAILAAMIVSTLITGLHGSDKNINDLKNNLIDNFNILFNFFIRFLWSLTHLLRRERRALELPGGFQVLRSIARLPRKCLAIR